MVVPVFDDKHLAQAVRQAAIEIYHLTWLGYSAAHYLPLAIAKTGVLTVPDFILWDHPEYGPRQHNDKLRAALTATLPWSDRLIVYSEYCKGQARERLGYPLDQIDVIPLAAEARFAQAADPADIERLLQRVGGPYLLTIGKDYPHKNLPTLVEAFARSGLTDYALVLAGESVWPDGRSDLVSLARKLGIAERIIFLDHVADEDLPALYQASSLFVFPSLEEGFGLPPLEAMMAGVPVVCSNAASLPEVVGDAALMVDARQPDALAAAMVQAVGGAGLREDLILRGKAQVNKFSWEQTADLSLASYQRAMADGWPSSPTVLAGPFLRHFPDDIPLITQVLAGLRDHPKGGTLFWVAREAFQDCVPWPMESAFRQGVARWIRACVTRLGDVDVLLEEDVASPDSLDSAIAFADPDRVVVLDRGGSDGRYAKAGKIEAWSVRSLLTSMRANGWLESAHQRNLSDYVVVRLPVRDGVLSWLPTREPVVGVLPLDREQPLIEPEDLIDVLISQELNVADRWVILADERVIDDADWIEHFRLATFEEPQPWKLIVPVQSKVPELIGQSWAHPQWPVWLICQLGEIPAESARALSQRPPGVRVALTLPLPLTDQSESRGAELAAAAWAIRADAAVVEIAPSSRDDRACLALKEEIELSVGRHADETVFEHVLHLQAQIIEHRDAGRRQYEQAMRAHVEQIQSYQDQIERFEQTCQALSRALEQVTRGVTTDP